MAQKPQKKNLRRPWMVKWWQDGCVKWVIRCGEQDSVRFIRVRDTVHHKSSHTRVHAISCTSYVIWTLPIGYGTGATIIQVPLTALSMPICDLPISTAYAHLTFSLTGQRSHRHLDWTDFWAHRPQNMYHRSENWMGAVLVPNTMMQTAIVNSYNGYRT